MRYYLVLILLVFCQSSLFAKSSLYRVDLSALGIDQKATFVFENEGFKDLIEPNEGGPL